MTPLAKQQLTADEDAWVHAMKALADAAKQAHITGAKLGHDVDTKTKVKLGALLRKEKKS